MQKRQLVSTFSASVFDKLETRVRKCWKEDFSFGRTELEDTWPDLISTSPWALMGYIHEHWESWQT